jgi:hypothetical protein
LEETRKLSEVTGGHVSLSMPYGYLTQHSEPGYLNPGKERGFETAHRKGWHNKDRVWTAIEDVEMLGLPVI